MLPEFWQKVSLMNPVLYLISGFRWSFFEVSDVSVQLSLAMMCGFLFICLGVVFYMFKTGYKLKP
jgi:ABC-2 type transport system permease protein